MAKEKEKSPQEGLQENKLKALQAAMAKIEKDFGRGAIMRMGDDNIENIDVIPTGSIGLDLALGVGGYPKGRIIEIYGPESSGKTTLAIHAIAEAQKAGGVAAFIDAEHAFDRFYAEKLGVNINELWISQPDTGEQALEIADQLIRSSAVDIVVIDSVAALTPKKELDGDMGDNNVGLQARLMSQALRKLTSTINKTNTTCIFINQLRDKIGVTYGPSETTTGGNALKFYSSVRLDIRRGTAIKDGDEPIGNETRVKVVKNKVAPPFKKAEFDIMYGEGISKIGEIIDLGVEHNIITKSGSWFSYKESKLGQGRDAAKKLLKDNPELCEEIEDLIKEEQSVIALTHLGYIKRMPASTYKSQHRGGKGITGMATRDEDFVKELFTASTHDNILFFTNKGKVYQLKGYDIPEASRIAKGTAIINLLPLDSEEKVEVIMPINKFEDDYYLLMSTTLGMIKKTKLTEYSSVRKSGIIAINLKDDDKLIDVKLTNGNSKIILVTRNGKAITFEETDVRETGRSSQGVIGIKLLKDDTVIGMDTYTDLKDNTLLAITESGFGKRTELEEYRIQKRGGTGVLTYNITKKTGNLVGTKIVNGNEDLMLITNEGTIIRIKVESISILSRATQGVTLIKTTDSSKVVSIETIESEEDLIEEEN